MAVGPVVAAKMNLGNDFVHKIVFYSPFKDTIDKKQIKLSVTRRS